MSVLDTCRCVGSFCQCNGAKVLKDGASIRVPLMLMDGSISGEKHLTADGFTNDSDRAYAAMRAGLSTMWQGGTAQPSTVSVADRAKAETKEVHDHSFAEARAAGMMEDAARSYAAREAMIHRDSNAWRGA